MKPPAELDPSELRPPADLPPADLRVLPPWIMKSPPGAIPWPTISETTPACPSVAAPVVMANAPDEPLVAAPVTNVA